MATEQGVVTQLGPQGAQTAWVKITRSEACASCDSRHGCQMGEASQAREVEVINTVNARKGDRIQVTMNTGSLLKATFLVYLFPIICLLAGGLAGHWSASRFDLNASVLPVLSAMAGLIAGFMIVRAGGRLMATKSSYRPRIVRVIGRDRSDADIWDAGCRPNSGRPTPSPQDANFG